MAQKSKGDKVSQKAEAPKPTTHARVAQNIYQPPKQKAKPAAEASRPAQTAKPAKAREVSAPKPAKPETQRAKAKDAPKTPSKRPAEAKARPADVKSKPAKPAARAEKQEGSKAKTKESAPKTKEKAAKQKPAEKTKPQEGLLQRGLSGAVKLYKQISNIGDAKPQGKAHGAKVEQSKPSKATPKGEKASSAAEKTSSKTEKAPAKTDKTPAKSEKVQTKTDKSEKTDRAEKSAPKTEKAPSKLDQKEKNESKHEKPAKAESKEKQDKSKGEKSVSKTESRLSKEPESGFSLTNLAGRALDAGKKLLMPEKEPLHVNKVENADKLTPQQRKEKGVTDYVDPKTGDRYDYNADGLLKQFETKNKQKTTYEYENGKPVNISKTQKILFLNIAVGSAEAVPGKVALSVDQESGEARTSFHEKMRREDPKTKQARDVEVKQEMVFHTNGSKSAITSDLDGKRLTKATLNAEDKVTAKVFYQYGKPQPGKTEGAVLATQIGEDGRVNHNYQFDSETAMKNQKVALREDIDYKRKGAIESERHETFDLRSGKEVLLNKTEKEVNYKSGQSRVHEQTFDKGKVATEKSITFDEHAKAVDMQFKDHIKNVDVKVKFDQNGSAKEIKGDYKNYTDHADAMKALMDSEVANSMAKAEIKTLDVGEMLAYTEKSQPRDGTKPTGILAWKAPGEDVLTQGKVKDGIVYDTNGNEIGKLNDRGDLTLAGQKPFNVINDKEFAGVFHGVGTDNNALNLYGSDGMNGYMSLNDDRVLMVGGNLISSDGKFLGHMSKDGSIEFVKDIHPPQTNGTDIRSFKGGGYVFKGNEDGNERRFYLENVSNGSMRLQKTGKNGEQILDANGQPVAPTDCEMRLGMVIDKASNKQLYNFIPPKVSDDKTFYGGAMISMDDPPKISNLEDMKGASFDIRLLGASEKSRMIGISTGPQMFQADGTPVNGSGGIVNLQRELELEEQNFRKRTVALDERLSEDKKTLMKGAALSLPNPLVGMAAADAYNRETGKYAQTEAEKTAFDLAKKHYDDQTGSINKIIESGQIDNTTLYKLQVGNERIRVSQMDELQRLQLLVNNPEHKLETVTAKSVDGTIKRPDLQNPGQIINYDVRDNLIYKHGSKQAVGSVNAQDGTMKIYEATGRVEVSRMNDPRLAGTVIHLEGAMENGQKQSVDWLSDGTGKLQSFAEMRKQAADQRKYFETLAADPSSTQRAKDGLERTIHNEQRFNQTLDNMLRNGVTDITVDQAGRIKPGYDLQKIIEGPKQNIQSEDFLREERMPPQKVALHSFNTQEQCDKASGAMRIGSEFYYCEKGVLYRAKAEGGKTVPIGEPVGRLEPGYVAEIQGRRISLQNESQFLFKFTVDGDTKEHRIFGTGPAHIDSTGKFTRGGLVEADELIASSAQVKENANRAMTEYFQEKPGGNPIADLLGWSVNKGLLDREGQMRYVGETIDNQRSAMESQFNTMFTEGFSETGLSNHRIDQSTSTVNRFMKDLNMSGTDMETLSVEGRNIQKQTSESVAMAATAMIPGGITLAAGSRFAAGSLLATSSVARIGTAMIGGGLVSSAVRQSEKVDWKTAFGTGMIEGGTMMIGAEGASALSQLTTLKSAQNVAKAEKLSEDALKVLYSEQTIRLAESGGGKALLQLMNKPGGEQFVNGVYRIANAGVQTTGFTLASSVRENNYSMMSAKNLAEGGAYMLLADGVAMLTHLPGPGIRFKSEVGKSADKLINTFTTDSVNNFANTLMTARVQANEVELENIARERGIPKDLISQDQFDKWKNQSRINNYLFQTAAEGMAMSFVTSPLTHAISDGALLHKAAKERTLDPQMAPDMTPQQRAERHDRLAEVMPPFENKYSTNTLKPGGEMEIAPHSGGKFRFNVEDGKVNYIQDANGVETHVAYDGSGNLAELRKLNKGQTVETWTKQGDEWVVKSFGTEFRSKETIAVTPDGNIVHISNNGGHKHNLDGSMHLFDGKGDMKHVNVNLNEDVRRNHVYKLIDNSISDQKIANRMKADIDHLMERVIISGKDRAEYAKTLLHVSELLTENPNAKLDLKTRQRLAGEALWLAANPTYLSQGNHPTCSIAAVEVRQYLEHPSDVMRALSEFAHTGEYKCSDGTIVRPFTAGDTFIFKLDADAKVPYEIFRPRIAAGTADGKRLMASQIWQTLATTAHYSSLDTYKGESIGKGNIGFHDDFVCDMSTNPPRRLEQTWGTKLRGPDLLNAVQAMTGRSENFALINDRYEYVQGDHSFHSIDELTRKIVNINEAKQFPIVYAVDVGNPPFNAEGGGAHIISILGMEVDAPLKQSSDHEHTVRTTDGAQTNKSRLPNPDDVWVIVDNQWSKSWDNHIQKVRLSDLYAASLAPNEAAAYLKAHPAASSTPGDHEHISEKKMAPQDEVILEGGNDKAQRIENELKRQNAEENNREKRRPDAPIEGYDETFVKEHERDESAQQKRAEDQPETLKEKAAPQPKTETPSEIIAKATEILTRPGATEAEKLQAIHTIKNVHDKLQREGLERIDKRAPEPFLQKDGNDDAPDTRYFDARQHKVGQRPEPQLLGRGWKLDDTVRRVLHIDSNPWFSNKNIDRFADIMTATVKNWHDISDSPDKSKLVTARLQELQTAVEQYLEPLGIPAPKLKLDAGTLEQRQANATFRLAGGEITLPINFLLSKDKVGFGTLIHELTHLDQDVAVMRLAALNAGYDGKNLGLVAREYTRLSGNQIDPTSPEILWLKEVVDGSKDWLDKKSRIPVEKRGQDAEIVRINDVADSFKNDKDSAEKRRALEDRTNLLLSLIKPTLRSDDKHSFIIDRLLEKPMDTAAAIDPEGFFRTLKDSKTFREKLYGYDPLDARFDARNEKRKDLPANSDHCLEKMLTDPALLQKHPDFVWDVVNGRREAYLKVLKSEFVDLHIPASHKSLQRLELKTMIFAAEHFYPRATNPEVSSSRRESLGKLSKASFEDNIKYTVREHLVAELRFTEDQKGRINFGNRYEAEPRIAAAILENRMTPGDRAADTIKRLQDNTERLNYWALMDSKVKGTLSEFGFEVKTADAIESGESVIVANIDLNNFKNINLDYSLASGDEALRVVGKEFENILRKYKLDPKECLGHFGGDEYGIVLKGVSDETAKQIFFEMQSVRVACALNPATVGSTTRGVDRECLFYSLDMKTSAPPDAVVVTATLGAVKRQQGQSAEDVLQSADKVMFEKKDKVKELMREGREYRIDPFSENPGYVIGQKPSDQLAKYRSFSGRDETFRVHGKSIPELREHWESSIRQRQLFLFELMNKHRHTQIWDKQKSKDILEKYIAKDEPFELLRLSVDNFKGVNDKFESHARGNKILKELGDYLLKVKREYRDNIEFMGSLGGTTPFMIIKDPATAKEVSEKINKYFLRVTEDSTNEISDHRLADQSKREIPVGFSTAIEHYDPSVQKMTLEQLLVESNRKLEAAEELHAQEGRRNRRSERPADADPNATKKRATDKQD